LNDSQISKLLFALEGIGAIFLGAFLIAYLMGLPTYTVYHSDPTLRMLLSFLGALLLILVLIALLISALNTKKDSIKITLST
jgi:ABC-type transport system involved in multi-copper enzyme maturation permease subunit